jgi:hypothetical protein
MMLLPVSTYPCIELTGPLTPPDLQPHNRSVPRVIATILALLMTGSIAAPVTCTGWESSSDARRQCCKRAHDSDCHDQQSSNDCCASHEQGQHVTPARSSAPLAPPPLTAVLPARMSSIVSITLALPLSNPHDRLHGPPHPLSTPLRI